LRPFTNFAGRVDSDGDALHSTFTIAFPPLPAEINAAMFLPSLLLKRFHELMSMHEISSMYT
jgi:hypothetical protein